MKTFWPTAIWVGYGIGVLVIFVVLDRRWPMFHAFLATWGCNR